jgi:competence protein ComEC
VVVWLVALPLAALRFHLVAPIGILLNVPLIPLTSLALMASGLALGVSLVWEPLARPFGGLAASCLEGTEWLVRWGASRPWGHLFLPGPSWGWVLVVYLLLAAATVAATCRLRWRRPAWGALAGWLALGAIAAAAPRPAGPGPEAEVLAVGHGLAVVVRTGGGHAVLYDCGRMSDPGVGRRIIAPALWARGIGRLDTVVLSHADADHYNGLPDLLDRVSIAEVRVPAGFAGARNPGASRLLEAVRARGVPVRPIAEGAAWVLGGVRFSAWHPPAGDPAAAASDNARSVVLEVESAGRRLLLTGDLEREGTERLLARPPVQIDALLAPHHGGRAANPERLYAWASPGLVVVSQRPPAAGTRDPLAAVEARGLPVLRTWQRGAIRLNWSAGGLRPRGFLDEEPAWRRPVPGAPALPPGA